MHKVYANRNGTALDLAHERFDPNVLATCFGSSYICLYATIGHHGFMLGWGCNSDEKAMGRPKIHRPTETT